jgi:hypothetical protein
VSASESFKVSNSLSFEGSGGILGNVGGGISFDYSRSVTDSNSLDIKKSSSTTIPRTGPFKDGIDHDEDAILLALKPTVELDVSSSSARWMLTNAPVTMQFVYIGWLNGHQTMPHGVEDLLKSAGITAADYPDILARDPLLNSAASPDANRFTLLPISFPHEPPYSASDPVIPMGYQISSSYGVRHG